MKRFLLCAAFLSLLVATPLFSCGGSGNSGGFPGNAGDGGLLGDATISADSGPTLVPPLGGGDASPQGVLTIAPLAPVLTVVTGQPVPTQQFTAQVAGQATSVAWGIDRGGPGVNDSSGLFTPAGTIGGVGNVTANYGGANAGATITVNVQTVQNGDPGFSTNPADAGAGGYGGVGGGGPGGPPTPGQTTTLGGTPIADATVSILYPYDGTVWPQGLLAPLLQWNAGAHNFDSVYVHIQEKNYDYKGYFAANKTPFENLPIPQQAWSTLGFSNGGDPVTISLVFGEGTKAYGPYVETWKIAQAALQGTIYYNSYGTGLVQNSDTLDSYNQQYGAGTLAIAPGATAPTLVAGKSSPGANGNGAGCRVCHTVAANGQSLVTQASNASANDYSPTEYINLAGDTTGGAGTPLGTPNLTYPALYKDGSLLLSSGGQIGYPASNNGALSQLYAVPAGTPVAGVTGLGSNFQGALPAFSPDGAHLSFNFWGGTLTAGTTTLQADQMSLGVLDFDGKSAFSNPRVLYKPAGGQAVTYSSFFPTAAGIVFEVELSNPSNNWGYTWSQNTGELWWADVVSGQAHRLDALNGYDSTGKSYLPNNAGGAATHTSQQDLTLNYEPTVNPIASGGYAWVVFTSRRMYGNVAQLGPWVSDPRQYPWRDQITDKKLWVAAVDLNGKAGTDPSHPAFYLPAQELHAGNARGYWTVEACRANGQTCQAGDQCCGGFCQPGGADGGLICTSQAPSCSAQFEKCTKTSDCCGAATGIQCINGICTVSAPK